MKRASFFGVSFWLGVSSPHVFAQGHVIMTPGLLRDTRNLTTYAPFPEYSASARARHLQGSGMFLLRVRNDGSVLRVDVVESTGHRELDDACISAYKQWRFRPEFAAKAPKVKIPVTFANP